MQHDPVWGALLLEPLEIVGIESWLTAWPGSVKFTTRPLNQVKVANELRRRLMSTFAEESDPLRGNVTAIVW